MNLKKLTYTVLNKNSEKEETKKQSTPLTAFALLLILNSLLLFNIMGCGANNVELPVLVSIETDKDVYFESDTVCFTIYISNIYHKPVEIFFHNCPGYDILVFHNTEEIWNWRKYMWTVTEKRYIAAWDTLIFGEERNIYWTQFDNDSVKVPRGSYRVMAKLDTDEEQKSDFITIELK